MKTPIEKLAWQKDKPLNTELELQEGEVSRKLRISRKWIFWLFKNKEGKITRVYGRNFSLKKDKEVKKHGKI